MEICVFPRGGGGNTIKVKGPRAHARNGGSLALHSRSPGNRIGFVHPVKRRARGRSEGRTYFGDSRCSIFGNACSTRCLVTLVGETKRARKRRRDAIERRKQFNRSIDPRSIRVMRDLSFVTTFAIARIRDWDLRRTLNRYRSPRTRNAVGAGGSGGGGERAR